MNDIDRHLEGEPYMTKKGVFINEIKKIGHNIFSCLLENEKEHILLNWDDIITKKSDGTLWETIKKDGEYWIREFKLKL